MDILIHANVKIVLKLAQHPLYETARIHDLKILKYRQTTVNQYFNIIKISGLFVKEILCFYITHIF